MNYSYHQNTRRKKKKAKTAVLFLAFLLIFVPAFFLGSRDGKATDFQSYEEIIVKKGDTIWSLAQENRPAGTEMRQYVFEIAELNNIEGSLIFPGEKIKIPY